MPHGVADEVREHLAHPLLVDADLEIGRGGGGEEQHVALAAGSRESLARRSSSERAGTLVSSSGTAPDSSLERSSSCSTREPSRSTCSSISLIPCGVTCSTPSTRLSSRARSAPIGVRSSCEAFATRSRLMRSASSSSEGHRVEGSRQLSHFVTGGRCDPPGVVAPCHRAGGGHHLTQRRSHPVRQHLDDRERECRRREAADQRGEAEALAEPDDADGDEHRGDDHDAELELDRVEWVERSSSSEFVSRA